MTKIYTLMIVAITLHLLNPVRLIAQTRTVTGIVTEKEDKIVDKNLLNRI